MKLTIGNVTLDNNVILAPMAGVTDLPYRVLCREQGCGLVCMEMVSAKAVLYKNRNTRSFWRWIPGNGPYPFSYSGQIRRSCQRSRRAGEGPYDIFDINMGCPVPKIVKNGEGSALMRNPKLVEEILSAMVRTLKKPVTVKIRKGFDDSSVNAVEIAKIAEGCGCFGHCRPWPHQRAVLFGKGGLGHHPPGQGGGIHSGHWKRRCVHAGGCEADGGGDRMRRDHGGPGSQRESLDLPGDRRIPGNREKASQAVGR